jgi:hypothetical protein
MEDCRVARLRALADALLSLPRTRTLAAEAARLNAEADAVLAVRAAGVSLWGSELPPLFLRLVLERLQWEPAVCGVMRAVCSTWCSILDALLPGRLSPTRSLAVMKGKLGWFQSLTEVDLTYCEEEDASGVLAELASMPSLRSLSLPSSCAERAVDAEAVCGLTTLTTLSFNPGQDQYVYPVEAGEWVLDLSRLTTLTSLLLAWCAAVTDKQVLAMSNLTGLTVLNLTECRNVTSEGLRAVSSLTELTSLDLGGCNVASEVMRAVSSLTALTDLHLAYCKVTAEGLRHVSSLTALTSLDLGGCRNVTSEGLLAVLK